MPRVLDPVQFVLMALAGWLDESTVSCRWSSTCVRRTGSCASNSETDECDSTTTSDVDWQPRRKAWGGDVWRKSPRLLHRRPCWRGIENSSLRNMMAVSDAALGDLARAQNWKLWWFAWRKRIGVGAIGGFRAPYPI